MKLTSFKYFPYELSFRNQFKTSTDIFKRRKVFFIELRDENGNSFWGEAAPLPQFNSESYDEVENELKNFSGVKVFNCSHSLIELFVYVSSLTLLPSVRFAFEQVFMNCLLNHNINSSIDLPASKEINVNALMGLSDFESSKRRIRQLISLGYNVIKLKTRDEDFHQLYELLAWVVGELNAKLKFRIDPNGSWNMKNTLLRSKKLEYFPVEYIEQPVKDINDLIKLSYESPIPLATDESLRTLTDAEHLIADSNIKFFVIKPMLFGGVKNIFKLIDLADGKNVSIITSSSLESNIGKRHLVLSSSLVNNNLAQGLGTSEMFSNQPAGDAFPVYNGMIDYSLNNYLSPFKLSLK
ncbi:o-succinylbenzoate synthase [hydrocarbon metagenome]|uniref:O-succinylbenzoate synthase n=1 Tax=hydrocarbon metagenome TaxID=938273 RepID=A0A0W8G0A1_9ZZZZ